MKDFYNIEDVALMTGLTTRTIRTYISDGFLEGDKSSGAWQFTAEQLDAFLKNDVVQAAVRTKRNAIVYDFMGSKPQNDERMCVVLDLSFDQGAAMTKLCCQRISDCKPKSELRFASDRLGKGVRVILSGSDSDVMELLKEFYKTGV